MRNSMENSIENSIDYDAVVFDMDGVIFDSERADDYIKIGRAHV